MALLRLVAGPAREVARAADASPPLGALFHDAALRTLAEARQPLFARELAFALGELARAERSRAVVAAEVAGALFEVGIERDGADLLVSVFRAGPSPLVVQADRRVSIHAAAQALLDVLEEAAPTGDGVALGREVLHRIRAAPLGEELHPAPRREISVRGARASGVRISARLRPRRPCGEPNADLRRTDLHALLVTGTLSVEVGAGRASLRGVVVHLGAELLVTLAEEAIAAWRSRRPMTRELRAGSLVARARVATDGVLHAALDGGDTSEAAAHRLPPLDPVSFARAVASFARAFCRALSLADPAQARNLRLEALGRRARALVRLLHRSALGEDGAESGRPSLASSESARAPESYRAFAEGDARRPGRRPRAVPTRPQRVRFTEAWRAVVPGIDLGSVLCAGEMLFVGSARELACIERRTGALVWSQPSRRGASILTPRGVARLAPDGLLVVHEPRRGAERLVLELAPCVGGTAAGAAVHGPGLPPLLLVGDGARQLTAVDLDAGEVRWRRALARRGPLRLRRAGKLVFVVAGEHELLALDLLGGELVWRRRADHRYAHAVAVDRDDLFALGTRTEGAVVVERLDPWTGQERWSTALARPLAPFGAPIVLDDVVVLLGRAPCPTIEPAGPAAPLAAVLLGRSTGELRGEVGELGRGRAGWLLVDELLVLNDEAGELSAVDLRLGSVRYRRLLDAAAGGSMLVEGPRSLQPVLRSGALFVPQSEVLVLRPGDGALLGRLPCDLVPDALRVDERCGVYVAEAAGHLAAYQALPSLALV
jgi:hypothetical protein